MGGNPTREEGNFISQDGLNIYWQAWRPTESKAVLIIVHGLHEHGGRYAPVAKHLNQHGYAVYALDHRGHGRSDGMRLYVDRFNHLVQDAAQFIAHVCKQEPGKPFFIFGHSMGGAVTITLAITHQPAANGILLSGPAAKVGEVFTPPIIAIAKFLNIILPKLRLMKPDSNFMTRDPAALRRYNEDPLVNHIAIPVRTGTEVLDAIAAIQAQMHTITCPMLIMHGTADHLTDPEGSKALYHGITSPDKILKLYEGLYHDLIHEPEKAKVLDDITAWLDAHL